MSNGYSHTVHTWQVKPEYHLKTSTSTSPSVPVMKYYWSQRQSMPRIQVPHTRTEAAMEMVDPVCKVGPILSFNQSCDDLGPHARHTNPCFTLSVTTKYRYLVGKVEHLHKYYSTRFTTTEVHHRYIGSHTSSAWRIWKWLHRCTMGCIYAKPSTSPFSLGGYGGVPTTLVRSMKFSRLSTFLHCTQQQCRGLYLVGYSILPSAKWWRWDTPAASKSYLFLLVDFPRCSVRVWGLWGSLVHLLPLVSIPGCFLIHPGT